MTIIYADFGWGRPTPSDLDLDKFSGVGRYSSSDQSKALGVGEAQTYIGAGLSIELFAENGAMTLGAQNGVQMGQLAAAHMAHVGAPHGMCNYLAEDYDAPQSDWPAVAAALDAFRQVLHDHGYLGGFYGKLALGEQMCRDGHVDQTKDGNFCFHQTEAWSGKAISPLASVYQRAQQVTVDGVAVDIDVLLVPNIGQWPSPSAPPKGNPVNPEYVPSLRPITCSTRINAGGVLAVADDGSFYYLEAPAGFSAHAGMNVDPKDWGSRVAAQVRIAEEYANKPVTVRDTANPSEFYDIGYQPGQVVMRWS